MWRIWTLIVAVVLACVACGLYVESLTCAQLRSALTALGTAGTCYVGFVKVLPRLNSSLFRRAPAAISDVKHST